MEIELGRSLGIRGDLKGKLRIYKSIKNNVRAKIFLADMKRRENKPDLALRMLSKIHVQDDQIAEAEYTHAIIQAWVRKYHLEKNLEHLKIAKSICKKLLKMQLPSDLACYYRESLVAIYLLTDKDPNEIINEWDKLSKLIKDKVTKRRNQSSIHYAKGAVHFKNADYFRAMYEFKKSFDLGTSVYKKAGPALMLLVCQSRLSKKLSLRLYRFIQKSIPHCDYLLSEMKNELEEIGV